jgi:hypothetical protein
LEQAVTRLNVHDGPKMLRETLCVAQARIGNSPYDESRKREHIYRLQRLIDECDRHRPIGTDGKHGSRHTLICGCVDVGPRWRLWLQRPGRWWRRKVAERDARMGLED